MRKNIKVAIIDYGGGNIHSAKKAFQHIKNSHAGTFEVYFSDSAASLALATHIVLPGQGAFPDCMQALQSIPQLIATLEKKVLTDNIPFLGICVGMQLLADYGYEHTPTPGLGWIPGEVHKLPQKDTLKLPHMGWNNLDIRTSHPLLHHLTNQDDVYFVHSYYFMAKNKEDVGAFATYGIEFPAIITHNNIMATQFHPEKSHKIGLQILKNFIEYT